MAQGKQKTAADYSFKHLSQYLSDNARERPDKPAVIDDQKQLSWSELRQAVEPMSRLLAGHLGANQQVVAILMPNSWQYVVTCLAVWQSGHVVMPVDVIYKSLEIDAVLRQLSPTLVISDEVNFSRIKTGKVSKIKFDDMDSLAAEHPIKTKFKPVDKQLASLLFTSGTTGKPKVVPHSHFHHLWNVKVCSDVWQWTAEDSLLISLRLSHWYGLVMGLVGCLYHGSTMYMQDRFDAEQTVKALADNHITLFSHAPSAYAKIVELDGSYDLSSVRLFISGSAPLPPAVWQQFKRRFDSEILEVYGTSETGRIASNLLNDRQPGSPGELLPGVRVKIDKKSEVLVKSPGVIDGYYKNPRATADSMAQDGWWRTSDTGQLNGRRLILKGRLHEKIRRLGYSLSPRDIEWALHKMPQIKEVQVLSVQRPDSDDDKLICYVVTDASTEAVRDFCKQNLPSVWRPDEINILPSLPRNRSGKVDIVKLKAMEGVRK